MYIDEIEELLKNKNNKFTKLEKYSDTLAEYFKQRKITYKASFNKNTKWIFINVDEYSLIVTMDEINKYEIKNKVDTETAFRILIKENLKRIIND
jgi:hypothetical protein